MRAERAGGGLRALLLIAVLLLLATGCGSGRTSPLAVAARLDVTGWDFVRDGSVELRGQWDVYYDRLLAPEDFRCSEPPVSNGYASLPGYWDADRVHGPGLGADGVATYRLALVVAQAQQVLALRLQETAGAYRLWIDDRLVAHRGLVTATAADSRPGFGEQLVPVRLAPGENVLLLQVSNHEHLRGGPAFPLLLGEDAQVRGRWRLLRYLDLMLFGALLVTGLYYAGLVLRRRGDRASSAIALMSLTWGPRALLWGVGGRALSELAPEAPWWLYTVVDLVLCQWGVAAILLYVTSVLRVARPERYRRPIVWTTAALSAVVLLAPWAVGGAVLWMWELACLVAIAWVAIAVVRAVQRQQPGALPVLVGASLLAMGGLHDILTDLGLLSLAYAAVMPIAVAAFIVSQSLAEAYRSHAGAATLVHLSEELRRRQEGLPITMQGDGERDPRAGAPPSSASRLGLGGVHVLLIDDDQSELSLMRELLEDCGARVSQAISPEAARERLAAQEDVNLVVLSAKVGQEDLCEFLQRLRQEHPVAQLPVILLTARDEEPVDAEAFACGASDYVAAPIIADELVARVHLHATLRQAYAEVESKMSLEVELERQRRRESAARLEVERASLETLRYQLNPHLLFNVLASIRGAIASDPKVARQMVSNLAEFFRLSLRLGAAETIGLRDELELLKSFVEIQRARYADDLDVNFEVDEDALETHVPALVLQPLLENAIKHGARDGQDRLRVRLEVHSQPSRGVQVTVSNTGSWEPRDSSHTGAGVGLRNVRERLGRFYSGRSDLQIRQESGWVHVELTLPSLAEARPGAPSGSSPAALPTPAP